MHFANCVALVAVSSLLFEILRLCSSAEIGIVLNLFLYFEQKWASCFYKIVLIKIKIVYLSPKCVIFQKLKIFKRLACLRRFPPCLRHFSSRPPCLRRLGSRPPCLRRLGALPFDPIFQAFGLYTKKASQKIFAFVVNQQFRMRACVCSVTFFCSAIYCIHLYFYKNNFIRTRGSFLLKP